MEIFSERPKKIAEIEENEQRWLEILARSNDADGTFVYAVHSTGIYCRPSCRARRPKRENIAFFNGSLEAQQAGFRPCLLCHPCKAAVQDSKSDLETFKLARNRQVCYQLATSPLGYLLVASTDKGVCSVSLGDDEVSLKADFTQAYPNAKIQNNQENLAQWVKAILEYLKGQTSDIDIALDIKATAFQSLVWNALCDIPYGCTRSYREVAQMIGNHKAVRAVARACASNPVAIVIPCHRVIRHDGGLGGYRWGIERKQTLLQKELEQKTYFQIDMSTKKIKNGAE
jgi:AraC family transcriptional regulator of adaptative response/methylated-DNA-[protein]-cysteine methyltransferase